MTDLYDPLQTARQKHGSATPPGAVPRGTALGGTALGGTALGGTPGRVALDWLDRNADMIIAACLAIPALWIGLGSLAGAVREAARPETARPALSLREEASPLSAPELQRLAASIGARPGVSVSVTDRREIEIRGDSIADHAAWKASVMEMLAQSRFRWRLAGLCAGDGCGTPPFRIRLVPENRALRLVEP